MSKPDRDKIKKYVEELLPYLNQKLEDLPTSFQVTVMEIICCAIVSKKLHETIKEEHRFRYIYLILERMKNNLLQTLREMKWSE